MIKQNRGLSQSYKSKEYKRTNGLLTPLELAYLVDDLRKKK